MNETALHRQVGKYLKDIKREVERDQVSPATLSQYEYTLGKVFLPWADHAGLTEPEEVTGEALHQFEDHLRTRPQRNGKSLARESVKSYVRAARQFLKKVKAPIDDFKPQKDSKEDPKWMGEVLSRPEIDKLEEKALDERDKLIIRVLADTGIRVSELVNLKREDLEANTHDRRYVLRIRKGKGGKARGVRIPPPIYKRLEHFAEHPKNEFIFCGKRRHNDQVEKLTRSGVDQLVRNLAKRVPELSERRVYPHLLRHSLTTHLAKENVSPLKMKEQLGHSTLAMIDRVYSHLKPDDLDDVMEALKA